MDRSLSLLSAACDRCGAADRFYAGTCDACASKDIAAARGSSEPRKLACDFAGERTNKERSGAQEHNMFISETPENPE